MPLIVKVTEPELRESLHCCAACGRRLIYLGDCLVCGREMAVHSGRDLELWDCKAPRSPCGQGHL